MKAGIIALILTVVAPIYEQPEERPEIKIVQKEEDQREQRTDLEAQLEQRVPEGLTIKAAKRLLHDQRYGSLAQEWLELKAKELRREIENAATVRDFFTWQKNLYDKETRRTKDISYLDKLEERITELKRRITPQEEQIRGGCHNLREIPPIYSGALPQECEEYLENLK